MTNCKVCYGLGTEVLINGKVCSCVPVLDSLADMVRLIPINNSLRTWAEIKRAKRISDTVKKHKRHSKPLDGLRIDIYPDEERYNEE